MKFIGVQTIVILNYSAGIGFVKDLLFLASRWLLFIRGVRF